MLDGAELGLGLDWEMGVGVMNGNGEGNMAFDLGFVFPEASNTQLASTHLPSLPTQTIEYEYSPANQTFASASPTLTSNSASSKSPSPSTPTSTKSKSSSKASYSKAGDKVEGDSKVKKRTLNTLAARRYRQKKVDVVEGLEKELREMRAERDALKVANAKLEGEVSVLRGLVGGS